MINKTNLCSKITDYFSPISKAISAVKPKTTKEKILAVLVAGSLAAGPLYGFSTFAAYCIHQIAYSDRAEEKRDKGTQKIVVSSDSHIEEKTAPFQKNQEKEFDCPLLPEVPPKHLDSTQIYDQAFLQFPKEEWWRLVIDSSRQEEGKDCFDKDEPGYLTAMKNALAYVRTIIGVEITPDLYCEIHDQCVKGVIALPNQWTKLADLDEEERKKFTFNQGFAEQERWYGLENSPLSEEVLKEWETDKLIVSFKTSSPVEDYLAICFKRNIHPFTLSIPAAKEKIQTRINAYYTELSKAHTSKDKFIAMARFCRALSMGHFFDDGNLRTITFALLPKLLIENGFPPAILDNPNLFEGAHSLNEMALGIQKGINNFLAYTTVDRTSAAYS